MKKTTLFTVTLIAGVTLLLTGTSLTSLVKMAFADPNPNNNGQQYAPGNSFDKGGNRENPSGGHIPPGQATTGFGFGNPGQCQTNGLSHDECHS